METEFRHCHNAVSYHVYFAKQLWEVNDAQDITKIQPILDEKLQENLDLGEEKHTFENPKNKFMIAECND